MKKLLPTLFLVMLIVGFSGSAFGLSFSSLSPDLTIGTVTGSGTQADPFVVPEAVTGLDVTMSITGLPEFGDPNNSPFVASFYLQKVVTNNTGAIWTSYDHELQEILGTASGEGDGLSFGQSYLTVRPFTSDKFSQVDEVTNVRDYVNFFNGSVEQGETVIFNLFVTDNSPEDIFYLRQRPNFSTQVPEPATILLLGAGLVGLAGFKRKKIK